MNIRGFLPGKLAFVLPYLLFLIAAAGFTIAAIFGIQYAYKSLIYVLPVFLAAVMLLGTRQGNKAFISASVRRISLVHLGLMTLLLFIISVILLVSFPTRPWSYFAVISLISGLIFAQIITERPASTDYLILLEIVLLSLDLIWGMSLKYPLYFGDTDILVHLSYIDTVVQTGHVIGFGAEYQNFPLFHIFNAIGVELTGLSLRNSYFILTGILWQAGILFAYLIFKRFSNSRIFSLAACLLLAVSQQLIYYGMYVGTRSLAYVLVLCWVYLILGKYSPKYIFLSLIAMSALIFTHHTTEMFFIPIITVVYMFQKLFTRDKSGTSGIQILPVELLVICFLTYIFYVNYSFTVPLMRDWFREIVAAETIASAPTIVTSGANAIYFSFVLFFSLIGIGTALKDNSSGKEHRNIIAIALASLVFLLFYVSGPLDLLPRSQIALFYRIPLLVSPFVLYMIAYGLNHFAHFEQAAGKFIFKKSAIFPIITSGFVVMLTFSSMISGANASDNSYILKASNMASGYFTSSELASFRFVSNSCDYDSNLYGDYETMANRVYLNDFPSRRIVTGGDISYIPDGYLIFRSGELRKTGGLSFSRSGYQGSNYRYKLDQTSPQTDILRNLSSKDRIFSSGYAQVYMINRIE